MTIHEALFSPVRQPLLGILYLLLTAQMALFFAACHDRRRRRVLLCLLLHLLFTGVCFWIPMWDIGISVTPVTRDLPLPAVLAAAVSLPVTAMVLYEVFTAGLLLVSLRDLLRYRRNHPTFASVKETMDLLPVGIAFGKPDGTVVFGNLAMNALSRALLGKNLTDLTAFRRVAATAGDGTQLTLPDGSATWQLDSRELTVDGAPFLRLTASDISQQAAIARDLAERNEKLRDLHMRLDLYNKQAGRIVIAQELLTARMTVHSEVGNVLLESRHYLRNPASIDEETLLQALKNTNTYLLREYEADDSAGDPLTDAVETAAAIGVDVCISGPIPSADPFRKVLAAAIGECATNTVKHAGGVSLSAEIRESDTVVTYRLKTDGEAPRGPVREAGGLRSLRTLVESAGGAMRIEAATGFLLTIQLPKGM